MEASLAFLALILGWLLGLLSPVITNSLVITRKRKNLLRGIDIELEELLNKMAGMVYFTNLRFGNFDLDLVNWLLPIFSSYSGANPRENIAETLTRLSQKSEDELAYWVALDRERAGTGLVSRQYRVPYLQSRIGELDILTEAKQRQLLDILSSLSMFNGEVEDTMWYVKMTFDSSLSTENHAEIVAAAKERFAHLGQRAKWVAERIMRYRPEGS